VKCVVSRVYTTSVGLALAWPWPDQGKCGAFTPLHRWVFFLDWLTLALNIFCNQILCIFMCCDVVRWLAAYLSLWAHVAMKIRPRAESVYISTSLGHRL
jgi:hypothetical protein